MSAQEIQLRLQICKYEDGSDHVLGTGAYGRVCKGIKGGVQDVAIKQVRSNFQQMQSLRAVAQLVTSCDAMHMMIWGPCGATAASQRNNSQEIAIRRIYA